MNSLKRFLAGRDLKAFGFGLFLVILSLFALHSAITREIKSYYITGFILFLFFGTALIRKSRKP
ncbi:MAG: hypothetical protein WCY49_06915 [Anaerovoracaceae bacterium]